QRPELHSRRDRSELIPGHARRACPPIGAAMNNNNNHSRPRVVITGMGAITPLGLNLKEFWDGLLAGRSGITRITQFDASNLPCQIAGEIKGFDPSKFMDFKEARRMSRCAQLAIATAKEGLADAGFEGEFPDPERVGIVYGTA